MSGDMRYVDCPKHGPRRRAYFVCVHLLASCNRRDVGMITPWEDKIDGAGSLSCKLKLARDHTVDEVSLACEDSLIEIGLLLPSETRLT